MRGEWRSPGPAGGGGAALAREAKHIEPLGVYMHVNMYLEVNFIPNLFGLKIAQSRTMAFAAEMAAVNK